MSIVDKIKIGAHALCCGTYTLFVSGFHSPVLYILIAVAYGAITLAEIKK